MTSTHPTAEQLERYRRRVASPDETRDVDAHVASCDRCWGMVRVDANPAIVLPATHLTYDELEAYVDGRADLDDRAIVAEHVAQCAACREELADLTQVQNAGRASARPGRLKPALRLAAAAAMVMLVALGAWVWLTKSDGKTGPEAANQPAVRRAMPPVAKPPRTPDAVRALALVKPAIVDTLVRREGVLRGSTAPAFRLQAPVGTVVLDDRPNFRWEAAPDAKSYDVAVADVESGSVAASGSCDTTWWRSAEPLRRGRTYSWQVTAHTAAGTAVVAPGPTAPEALFHVADEVETLPAEPLERGVALANLGVLDEAEQSLERAAQNGAPNAAELLEEVRSWRTSSHGLPTETKGAQ
jgi:hypothetical protein